VIPQYCIAIPTSTPPESKEVHHLQGNDSDNLEVSKMHCQISHERDMYELEVI